MVCLSCYLPLVFTVVVYISLSTFHYFQISLSIGLNYMKLLIFGHFWPTKKLQFLTMQPNIWNSGTERENESYSSIHVTFRYSTNIYSAQSKTPVLIELHEQSVQDSYIDLCNPFYPLSPFNSLAP